jgi:hypothetical protein
MKRTEPPPLATWILEHGIPGDYDEALAGDLLEEFRSGRSDGWFWRQVLAAWLVGWLKYLSMRRSLLVFAALWSAVAPTWAAIVDRIDSFDSILTWKIGHLFLMFCFWVALNLAFIFVGMLLFIIVHSRISSAFSGSKLGRAFMLAPLIFLPLYFATFVVMNLFAYPGFVIDEGARTPLGEIADFNLRADALRIPYFLTLLWAMWGATPLMKSFSITPIGLKFVKPPTEASIPAANASPAPSPPSYADPYTTKRFLVFMVGAGLLNALIAGFLLCRLPDSHTPSLQSLLIRATIYVAIGALAGIAGIYLYWNSSASPFRTAAPIPFSLFALACAAGWIWVPSMVIFSEQLSAATAFVGAIGAFLLAASLRHATSFVFAPKPRAPSPAKQEDFPLFAESLYRAPREPYGYVIALSLYAAGWALATRSNYTGCALLALSASIFAWQRTLARDYDLDARREYKRAALRLALVFIPAVLVTIWALLDGVAHRNYLAAVNAARSTADAVSTDEDADQQTKTPPSATGISGYQSVILWPVPEKKQILPPLPPQTSLLAPGTTKPLIIKFDGPYWYFQPPHKGPSPRAFQVRGTPLVHDFQTNNFVSLIMEAHQTLGASIPVARCREIQVGILNSDNRRGIINLAVLLTDSSSPSKPQLYLGLQPVTSSLSANFAVKSTPVGETLRFSIPSPSKIRKFDEITVMFFPDASNYDIGPKVAIDQFQLIPR